MDQLRIAFLAVNRTPIRAKTAEDVLLGRPLDAAAIRDAQEALDADLCPMEDEHTPVAMRMHLARVLLNRLLERLEAMP